MGIFVFLIVGLIAVVYYVINPKESFINFRLEVFEDKFKYYKSNNERVVYYDQIETLNFYFIKHVGGSFKVNMKDDSPGINFGLQVENINLFLDQLKKVKPELCESKNFESFQSFAIKENECWKWYPNKKP